MAPEHTAPLVGGTTTDGGVTVLETSDSTKNDPTNRLPSFQALARETGGLYAEKLSGMTVDQALVAAGLDFTVAKHDGLSVVVDDGTRVSGLDRLRGTVAHFDDDRSPVLLGVVGHNYPVVQPREAAEFGQAVLQEGGATVAAIGAYGNPRGARMFIALKLPEGLLIGGEDRHDLYLGLGNSWDRGTGLWAVAAPIRLDCTNQFTATFGKRSNRFSIPHRGDMLTKVSEVQRALDLTNTFTDMYAQLAEKLLSTPMRTAEINEFVEVLLPTPREVRSARGELAWAQRRSALAYVIREGERNTTGRGTRYAALQGAVEWSDWMTDARTPLARATRLVDGGRYEQIKNTAADLLMTNL